MPVVCQLCGFECETHIQSHLHFKHKTTAKEYMSCFPGFSWMSSDFEKRMIKIRKDNANTPTALQARSNTGKANKGKTRDAAWREERSRSYSGESNPFYGKKHSLETKVRLSCHFRGISEDQFDDFTKPESFRQTKSGAFRAWRKLVFERDNYTCLLCDKRGGALEPHHIIPRREDKSKIYMVDNGATLCKTCHKTTFKREHEFVETLTEKVGRRVVP